MTSAEMFYKDVSDAGKLGDFLHPERVTGLSSESVKDNITEAVFMCLYVMEEDNSKLLLIQHPVKRHEYFPIFIEGKTEIGEPPSDSSSSVEENCPKWQKSSIVKKLIDKVWKRK